MRRVRCGGAAPAWPGAAGRPGWAGAAGRCCVAAPAARAGRAATGLADAAPLPVSARSASASSTVEAAAVTSMPAARSFVSTSALDMPCSFAIS